MRGGEARSLAFWREERNGSIARSGTCYLFNSPLYHSIARCCFGVLIVNYPIDDEETIDGEDEETIDGEDESDMKQEMSRTESDGIAGDVERAGTEEMEDRLDRDIQDGSVVLTRRKARSRNSRGKKKGKTKRYECTLPRKKLDVATMCLPCTGDWLKNKGQCCNKRCFQYFHGGINYLNTMCQCEGLTGWWTGWYI